MNPGRMVFSQLTDLLPRRAFNNAMDRYDARKRVRGFSCTDQLLCMIFAQVTGRSSLRETVLCLNALGSSRYHCGIRGRIARSTLAAVNERRDHRIFMDTAMAMIHADRLILPVDPDLAHLTHRVYAIDSTTIDLCLQTLPLGNLFRRRKAGIKAHTILDVKLGIPVFLRVSNAKVHDLWFLDQIVYQPGAFYVVDKGYIDFASPQGACRRGFLRDAPQARHEVPRHRAPGRRSRHRRGQRPAYPPARRAVPHHLSRFAATHPVRRSRKRQTPLLHHQQPDFGRGDDCVALSNPHNNK